MPAPTPKEKFTIGVYVGILTIVILIIWGFFLKYQFNIIKPQDPGENTWQNIGDNFNEFKSKSQEGFNIFQEDIAKLKETDSQKEPEVAENFALLIKEELFKKRISDWQSWSYNDFSLKYPLTWQIEPAEMKLILSLKEDEIIINKVTVNFLENVESLSAMEWWESLNTDSLEVLTAMDLIIDNQPAYSVILNDKEIVYVLYDKWMVEIFIENFKESEKLSEQINDFIKTISLTK